MRDIGFRIHAGLRHAVTAKSRYYVHSPFVYSLLTDVLNKPLPYEASRVLTDIRREQRNDPRLISVEPVGTSNHITKQYSVARLAKRYALPLKHGTLLFKLVQRFKPSTILETGTGTGFSAACLALGNPDASVHTVDALQPLIDVATESLQSQNIRNVVFHRGQLDDVLESVCRNIRPIEAVYLDANHTCEATLRYFDVILQHLTTTAFVIVDDIHWSKGMNNAWLKLCKHPRVTVSLDFYRLGLLFLAPDLSQETFRLYY